MCASAWKRAVLRAVVVDDGLIAEAALPGVLRALQMAGVAAISARPTLLPETEAALRAMAGEAFLQGEQAVREWEQAVREWEAR